MDVDGKTVMVTGGGGFLGTHLVARFQKGGARVCVPRHAEFELAEREGAERAFEHYRPDVVVHAAADVGGIGRASL